MGTTATKKPADKKPADKKPAKKDEPKAEKPEAPAKKEAPVTRPQRVSAKITVTQSKTIEDQFDTAIKRNDALDDKLEEIEEKFVDKPDHQFAKAVRESRSKLSDSTKALVESKEAFAEIGETLRDFFG